MVKPQGCALYAGGNGQCCIPTKGLISGSASQHSTRIGASEPKKLEKFLQEILPGRPRVMMDYYLPYIVAACPMAGEEQTDEFLVPKLSPVKNTAQLEMKKKSMYESEKNNDPNSNKTKGRKSTAESCSKITKPKPAENLILETCKNPKPDKRKKRKSAAGSFLNIAKNKPTENLVPETCKNPKSSRRKEHKSAARNSLKITKPKPAENLVLETCKEIIIEGQANEYDELSMAFSKKVQSFNQFFESKLCIAPEEELTESEINTKRAMLEKIVRFSKMSDQVPLLGKYSPIVDKSGGDSGVVTTDVSERCGGNSKNDSTSNSHCFANSLSANESENGDLESQLVIGENCIATSPLKSDVSADNKINEDDIEQEQEFNYCDNVQVSSVSGDGDHEDITNEINNENITEQRDSDDGIVMDQISQCSKKTEKSDFSGLTRYENRCYPRKTATKETKILDWPRTSKIPCGQNHINLRQAGNESTNTSNERTTSFKCLSSDPGLLNDYVNLNKNEVLVWSTPNKTSSVKKRKLQQFLENGIPQRTEMKKKRSCTTPNVMSNNCEVAKIDSRVNVSTPVLEFKETQPIDLIERFDRRAFYDGGVVKKPGCKSVHSPRAKTSQTLSRNKTQSPRTSGHVIHKAGKGSLFEHLPHSNRQLNDASTPCVTQSNWYPSKQQNMRADVKLSQKSSSDIVNELGLSPRRVGLQKNVSVHQFNLAEETENTAFSRETSTKPSPAACNVGQKIVYKSSSSSYKDDSSSEYETLSAVQNRGFPLNSGNGPSDNVNEDSLSQTSEVSIYEGFYKEPVDLLKGAPNRNIQVEKIQQSWIKDPDHKWDSSDIYKRVAESDRDMPSFSPKHSCTDEDHEWKNWYVNWDEPTSFDGENSFGVFCSDAASHHKALNWTNELGKMLQTKPILKKKPLIESYIKSTARKVELFDAIGTSPALALSQSTMQIIKDSCCPQYWNGETCDKTCKKKHKMNCDEFLSVSSDEVFRAVSARLMEMEKPPLEMVSSFIEWLAEHKENIKLLSFSKILLTNKGLTLCTTICSLFIKNLSKQLGWQPASVVEYLLKFHYFMIRKQRSKIVPVLNKLIAYCQVGTYKHKVYPIIRFILDNEGYSLPIGILDKLIHEVNNNPPQDIMATKDKIKNQLKSFEKCDDQHFRARAYTFLRTYFPENYRSSNAH